jgi:hypothetical protein
MHYEDATKFLIERLRAQPGILLKDPSQTEWDVYVPRAVQIFLQEENPEDRNLYNIENCRNQKYQRFLMPGADLNPHKGCPLGDFKSLRHVKNSLDFSLRDTKVCKFLCKFH